MKVLMLVPLHKAKIESITKNHILSETGLPYNQVHNYWYCALKALGHKVKAHIYSGRFPTLDYYSSIAENVTKKIAIVHKPFQRIASFLPSMHKKQKELLRLCEDFKPHLVLLSGNTDLLLPETLIAIKKKFNSKLVLLNGLSPAAFATRTERIMAPYFDYIFTNDTYHAIDWIMLGAHKAKAIPISAIDPQTHKLYKLNSTEKQEYACDVAFVGSLYPYALYRDRIELLQQLSDFNLKIWSYDKDYVNTLPKLKKHYAGEASGIKMFKIFNIAKISLNFHGHRMPSGGNMRTFEIPGCQGFEIVDTINHDWFAIDKEIVTFKDITDLKAKIRFYLRNDKARSKIAIACHKRTIKDHTYIKRFKQMLHLLSS